MSLLIVVLFWFNVGSKKGFKNRWLTLYEKSITLIRAILACKGKKCYYHAMVNLLDKIHICFYSEACTFLSATRLVFLIAENYNELIVDSIDILSKISLFTDSMSMIKKLNSMDAYPTAHLKTVMDSERYILQALRGLIEQLDERI